VCVCGGGRGVCVCVCVKRHLLEFGEKVPFDCSEANSQESAGSEIDNS